MSSFLFEKEQINCTCFDNSPKADRRIFRSQSYHASSINNKQSKQTLARNQSEKGKHKKKSLKKQKQISSALSQKDLKQKDQIQNGGVIPQLPANSSTYQYKKQQKAMNFQNFQGIKFLNQKTQKMKPSTNLRNYRVPDPLTADNSLTTALNSNMKIVSNNSSVNPSNSQTFQFRNKKLNSVYQRPICYNNQYQQIINQQFQKDLHNLKMDMQSKMKIYQNQKNKNEKIHFENKNNTLNHRHLNSHFQIKQRQKLDSKITLKSRKQSLSANKNAEEKDQPLKINLDEINNKITNLQFQHTPSRIHSFRNSTASQRQRQKQSISKKLKGKMFPKQIQSQKDGSSSQSDQLSEVLGRGWDGLTQQRLQIQQLQEMAKREKMNTQTMVTQQSNIRNSQIKTFTDYSNSFISPKSQYSKGFPFGGVHKYGTTGMSYHQIEEFGKPKNYTHHKTNF